MAKERCLVPSMVLLFLLLNAFQSGYVCAKEKKPTAEEIVAKHIESIGSPEKLAAVKSRTIFGIVAVRMPFGTVPQILPEPGTRKDPSNFLFASTENSMGIVMKFYNLGYTGEHLAFDGKDATISITSNGKRSSFADFVARYDGVMREGFLGGTLSASWPLLRIQDGKYRLKYDQLNSGGKKFHQITCTPKDNKHTHDMIVRLIFEFDTYRHVMTEYASRTNSYSIVIFLERFGNFKEVDGLMLPHSYSMQDADGTDLTAARWSVEVKQISHGESIDPQLFHAK
jgi:hypothetical protein